MSLKPVSTRRIVARGGGGGERQRKKTQLDRLATNTDGIATQSHSFFACLREKNCQVENRLKGAGAMGAARSIASVAQLVRGSTGS